MRRILTLTLAGLWSLPLLAAPEANPVEAKLREQLRTVLLQQRTLQAERDTAQASKLQLEQEKAALAQQLETAQKALVVERDSSTKATGELQEKNDRLSSELMQTKGALDKWKASQQQAVEVAKAKEAARAKLALEKVQVDRVVVDQRARNQQMYQVAQEILSRYASFGLGTAIGSREPFISTARVRLENLVQDLDDQLSAARIKITDPARTPPTRPESPER